VSTLRINRGEAVAIPFTITDSAGSLIGKRVTWSLAPTTDAPPVLVKQSAIGASSADVVIDANTATEMAGSIRLTPSDFDVMADDAFAATLWIDSGVGDDRCVTPGGADLLVIVANVARELTP